MYVYKPVTKECYWYIQLIPGTYVCFSVFSYLNLVLTDTYLS